MRNDVGGFPKWSPVAKGQDIFSGATSTGLHYGPKILLER